jgi:hypothetical protein
VGGEALKSLAVVGSSVVVEWQMAMRKTGTNAAGEPLSPFERAARCVPLTELGRLS